MTRIRVNTEDLRAKAKDFESAADAFSRAGDDIAAVAAAMPSYDGQLSGPARKAGAEIQSQARDMRTALANDAQSLRSAAQGFEAVENQAVETLNGLFSALAGAVGGAVAGILGSVTTAISDALIGVKPDSCGNRFYGYERDPLTGTVTIYNALTGEVLVFTADDLKDPLIAANVESFKDNINGMNAGIVAEGTAAIALVVGAAAALIGIVAAPTGIGAVAAWGVAAVTLAGGIGTAVINAKPLIDSVAGCNNMFNALKIQRANTPSGSPSPP